MEDQAFLQKTAETVPEIIKAAAQSQLGIFALMILGIAGLGYCFFRSAGERTRVTIFTLMLIGVTVFGATITYHALPASSPSKVIEAHSGSQISGIGSVVGVVGIK